MKKVFDNVIRKNLFLIFILIFVLGFEQVMSSVIPYLFGKFIDNILYTKALRAVKIFGGILFIGYVGSIFFELIHLHLQTVLSEKMGFETKLRLIQNLRKKKFLEFKKNDASYLTKRIDQDVDAIYSFILDDLPNLFVLTFCILYMLFLLFRIQWIIGLVVLLLIPVYIFIYMLYKDSVQESEKQMVEKKNILFQSYNDQLEYMYNIKLEAKYEEEDNFLHSVFKNTLINVKIYLKNMIKMLGGQFTIMGLSDVGIILLSGYMVYADLITAGQMISIIFLKERIMAFAKSLYARQKKFFSYKVAKNRCIELVEMDEDVIGNEKLSQIDALNTNIVFSYNDNEVVLDDLKINANKGEIIIIKGGNGSGKSTFLQLLNGMFTGKGVNITLNGKNLKDLDTDDLRRNNITNIPQIIRVKEHSVNEYLYSDKTRAQILEAFNPMTEKDANTLNKFLDYVENKNIDDLSGGERQFLYFVKKMEDPKDLVILDEFSSNLDLDRTNFIVNYLERIKEDHIIILVTHDTRINIEDPKLYTLEKNRSFRAC